VGSSTEQLTIAVNDPAPEAPSNLVYPTNPVSYYVLQVAQANLPTNSGGRISSYCLSTDMPCLGLGTGNLGPLLPKGLTLNSTTGNIEGTPTQILGNGRYTIVGSNASGSTSVILNLGSPPAPFSYVPNTLTCTKGIACSLIPTGGSGTLVAHFISPGLPAGLTLDLSGTISGTPTVASPLTAYTVSQTYTGGVGPSVSVSVVVNDVPDAGTGGGSGGGTAGGSGGGAGGSGGGSAGGSGGGSALTAPAGIAYSSIILTCTNGIACSMPAPGNSGGAADAWFVAPALPLGLHLDLSTGAISGASTTTIVAAKFVVTATNSVGTASTTLYVAVNDAVLGAITYAQNPFLVGEGVASTPDLASTANGVAFNWCEGSCSIVGGGTTPDWPPGLSFNIDGKGSVAGTPTRPWATTQYVIIAYLNNGAGMSSTVLTIGVAAPVSVYAQTSLTCYLGVACSLGGPSNPGGSNMSYSIGPALPAGLTFSAASGGITGTPSAVSPLGTYVVTSTFRSNQGSTTTNLTVQVLASAPDGGSGGGSGGNAAPKFTYSPGYVQCARLQPCSLGLPISTGGSGVSYSIAPALPAGMSLVPGTGLISGSAVSALVFTNYTVTGTNGAGTSTAAVALMINALAPGSLSYSPSTLNCLVNAACLPATPSSTGDAPTSYSITQGGALPSGLALDSLTGILSGTATSPISQAYQVTGQNSAGKAAATVIINIAGPAAPNSLVYPINPVIYTVGTPAQPDFPSTDTGCGTANSNQAASLPAGLSLNYGTGNLEGTPTQSWAATTYSIIARNSVGSTSTSLQLSVQASSGTGPDAGTPGLCVNNLDCSIASPSTASCIQSRCVATLASSSHASYLAIDDSAVYWSDTGNSSSISGSINAIAKQGGAPLVLAANRPVPSPIAVDQGFVYWEEQRDPTGASQNGGIFSLPVSGGTPSTILSPFFYPYWLAVSGPDILYATSLGPLQLDASGTMSTVAPASIAALTISGGNIYWVSLASADPQMSNFYDNNASVFVRPLAGGVTTTLATGLTYSSAVAVDANYAYVTQPSAAYGNKSMSTGSILRISLADGSKTTLAAGYLQPLSIAVDASYVYWLDFRDGSNGTFLGWGSLRKTPIGGGAVTVLADHLLAPISLAIDSSSAFFTASGNYIGGGTGTITRVWPK
jgi:hypothetical protein